MHMVAQATEPSVGGRNARIYAFSLRWFPNAPLRLNSVMRIARN